MKVLVTWESKHGATAVAAESVPDISFDAYVIGSAVYAGHGMRHIKQFVYVNRQHLLSRPVWPFSSGPIGDPPKPQEPPVDITEILEWAVPQQHMIFAGRLERANLPFVERAIAAALHAPYGDFRDWDAIRGWAAQIAKTLQ